MDRAVVDCHELSSLPLCGRLRQVLNMGNQPLEIQGFVPESNNWYTIIPYVAPHTNFDLPFGCLWLPRNMIVRSVVPGSEEQLETFGVVGDGIAVIQR